MRRLTSLDLGLVTGRFPQEVPIYRKAVGLAARGHRVTMLTRELGDVGDAVVSGVNVELLAFDSGLRDPRRLAATALRSARALVRGGGKAAELARTCRTEPGMDGDAFRQFLRHVGFLGQRPAILHFEFLGIAAMYSLAANVVGAPTIVSCRGSDIHLMKLRNDARQAAMRASLQHATAIHCVSDEVADCVRAEVGDRPGIWVNRPAVDTTRIRMRTWENRHSSVLRIIATGRLVWIKGVDYLLTALADLARRGVRFDAEILGDGPLLAPLRSACHDLGIAEHVRLPGAVSSEEALARLQAADVFVVSSHNEGVSNAALEAMASGVPVVSTRVGGMPEAITHGVDGMLVPPRDATLLADALAELADSPQRLAEMGHAARAKAEAAFSIERQLDVFEDMYRAASEAA